MLTLVSARKPKVIISCILYVKLMPLVDSWLSANLVVRVLFRAPHVQHLHKAIYIKCFSLCTLIAKTMAVCHCQSVCNDKAMNQMVGGDFDLLSVNGTRPVEKERLTVIASIVTLSESERVNACETARRPRVVAYNQI